MALFAKAIEILVVAVLVLLLGLVAISSISYYAYRWAHGHHPDPAKRDQFITAMLIGLVGVLLIVAWELVAFVATRVAMVVELFS